MTRLGMSGLVVALLAMVFTPVAAMAQDDDWDDWDEGGGLPIDVHGFVELSFGSRVRSDPLQTKDIILSDARFRLDLAHFADRVAVEFKGDVIADGFDERVYIDIREATLTLNASRWLDLKIGRQVLTWGTGDLLFLNDLFPKDFVSFFIGRDDEFLKAPQNAVRTTFYSAPVNLDLVWTPVFAPDRFITGERLSFFSPASGSSVSAGTMGGPLGAASPEKRIGNGELAGRLFRTVGGYELAVYGYLGFTKQPLGFDPVVSLPTHGRLGVLGASIRGNVAGGIANVEAAYHDTSDDDGTDPNQPNGQFRGLIGYERELAPNLTGAAQYYVERISDHEQLVANSSAPQFEPVETRHQFTTRLTYRMMQQTLTASLFAFVSPNGGDGHLRPAMSYRWSDAVTVSAGANVMLGDEDAFFGQLARGSNLYLRGRYGF